MRIVWPVLLGASLVLSAPVAADDEPTPRELLDRAIASIAEGESNRTAIAFGRAVRAAHDQRDALAERDIVRPLTGFLLPLQAKPEELLAAVTLVVTRLDAQRTGAFVSIPGLGLDALYCGTVFGRLADVADTAGYVSLWAGPDGKEPCAAARPIGRYARALEQLGSSEAAATRTKAIAHLEAARSGATKHAFEELLLHVTAELVVQLHLSGEHKRARDTFDAYSRPKWALEKQCLLPFDEILQRRLGDDADQYFGSRDDRYADPDDHGYGRSGGGRVLRGEGGVGGRRGRAGQTSPLGDAWNRGGNRRIVSVTRRPKGFRVRPAFAGASGIDEPFADRCRVQKVGGVSIAFFGKSVAIYDLDLTGRGGRHRESEQRDRFRAFHLLAEGERVTFSKQSGLVFSRK